MDIEKIQSAIDNVIKSLLDLKNSIGEITSSQTTNLQAANSQPVPTSELEELKQMVQSEHWPEAVNPNLICDPNSDADKEERSTGIIELMIDENLKGLKFLDYGCGEGQTATVSANFETALSVGYDIKNHTKWQDFTNCVLTTDFETVKQNGPYDIILLFDVIDHLEEQSIPEVLSQVRSLLADNGKIYLRAHPWTSRHATHVYRELNKAYVHLVFTNEELNEILPQGTQQEPSAKITLPIKTYTDYFNQAQLQIVERRDIQEHPETFFKAPLIQRRIIKNNGFSSFPEFQMSLQFLDFVLKKN